MTVIRLVLKRLHVPIAVSALSAGLLVASADAQQAAPTDNKGFKATAMQTLDLGPEIEGMSGRQLRMRTLTIEPGGYIGMHSHKDRPAVVYFLKGTDTVTFADGTVKVFRPGDTSFANKDTTHWHQNKGNDPVVLIAVDVFHVKK
jgi:quercetin dioxygenase-like cupin family protein